MIEKNLKSVTFCQTCNNAREIWNYKIKTGRGKFCSQKCYYKSRKGVRISPKTEFVKGHAFGKRFKKGEHPSLATEFKKTKGKPYCISCGKELCSYKALRCKNCNQKGKRSPFWKGGVSIANRTERQNFMTTPDYKKWRKEVFIRNRFTCQICEKVGGILQVDHLKPYSIFPESRLDPNNGRTLCLDCHRKSDGWGNKIYKFIQRPQKK